MQINCGKTCVCRRNFVILQQKLTFKSKNIGDKITFQSIKHGNTIGQL